MKYSTIEVVNMKDLRKKPCECMKCHNGFTDNADVVKIYYEGLAGEGHHIYGHINCVKPCFYGDEAHENLGGTQNVTYEKTPRTSMEIEMFNASINPDGHYLSQHERQERAWKLLTRLTKTQEEAELTDLYVKFLVFGTKHKEVKTLQDIGLDCSTALEGHITELSFEGSYRSIFTFKREPSPECISTIECCYYIIKEFQAVGFVDKKLDPEPLMNIFKAMIKLQLTAENERVLGIRANSHDYDAKYTKIKELPDFLVVTEKRS